MSTVPVTLPDATTFPITLPKSFDLSDLPVTLPETPTDIPVEDIKPEIELPEVIDLSDVPVILPDATLEVITPETIDLSRAGVILPAGLQSLLDALGGGEGDGSAPGDGPGEAPRERTGRGQGNGGLSDQARQNILNEERRSRRDINEGNAVATGLTSSDVTAGLRNRSSGGNPLDLNRILDGFERLIESGLSGLPDFLEPFVREIASQGVGVSTEGGQTFLTTADGTKIATLSQDEDSGATTVATLPEAVTGGDTSGTDDSSAADTTTVRIGGGDPGRPGINQPLIDPLDYLSGLEGAIAGQLTPEALSNAFASAILGPNQTPVFEATLSPNQIVIQPTDPQFAPREQTDPLIPTFQRPTLERRPPDPSLVEVDYGELFEGALGDFTGGEGALDRLVYFLSGLELPDAPAPVPGDDDTPQAPSGIPQVEAPTIDLSALNLNEIGLLSNALLGELANIASQTFEVQASILGAGVATAQSINLLAVSQLPIINSLASIDTGLGFVVEAIDQLRSVSERIADAPLVDQLIAAGFTLPTTVEEPTDFPDIALSQGGRDLFTAIAAINQRVDELVSPEVDANLATMENLAGQMQPPDLSQMPGSSAGSPMYILDAAPDRVRKVEIVGGKVEAEIVNKSIPVTLGM